jgi:hypothetical protein
MTLLSFPIWLRSLTQIWERAPTPRLSLSALASLPVKKLPKFVQESEVALKYVQLLGMLDWQRFPDRPDQRFSPTEPPMPYAPLVAAYLVKIDQHIAYVADLWQYLIENPALVWVLGFPLCSSPSFPWGFDVKASLPTHRHLSRLLRTIPNDNLQFLLGDTVSAIRRELPTETRFGECISLDTKHIIAWVQENNPKTYIEQGRYDKNRQPAGDPDCRLGCKRKHNQRKKKEAVESLPAETTFDKVGEYYWGYGSGVIATKAADWGEFVLAELTQTFNQSDVSYFKPLMECVEQRLGFRPRFGAFDAAFDAFYVYEYFANAEPPGFAAVPFVERGRKTNRQFDAQGAPLCEAGIAMSLRYAYWCKTALIPHERGRYVCPLRYPTRAEQACPIQHAKWAKGGCITTLATSPGSRLRYQLDRHSEEYKAVYKQRTATERVNSQAVAFGIERPKLRNGTSIANHNTLTYVLINLHALQRIRLRRRIESVETETRQTPTDSSSKERA